MDLQLIKAPVHGIIVALYVASSAAQPADSLERERVSETLGAQLDSLLTRFSEYGFSGAVLVVRDRRIVLLKGYGLADLTRSVRNSAATRFEMNSLTKMFTGVSILQLAAAGRLRLTDSVERYLGGLPGKSGATIEQLATHTSGLIVKGTALAGESRDAFLRDVRGTPREAAPGRQYRYTNAGFSLLAAIIEVASGQTYEDYLRDHAFAPAGMRTATFRPEVPATDTLFARGYRGTPAGLEPGPPNPYEWGTRGAGGVWTTVGDIYRWVVAVEDGRVLRPAQRSTLFSLPKPPAEEGFGWHVRAATATEKARIDKGGGSDDFASQLLYYPEQRVVIVWASNNLRQRWRRTLNQAIPNLIFGSSAPRLPGVARLPPADIAGRAGQYLSGADSLELRAGGNYLYASTNTLRVPTSVMFFPQDSSSYTAFDPATGTRSRMRFSPNRRAVTLELDEGRRVRAERVSAVSKSLRQ